jgi:hypothetical protein
MFCHGMISVMPQVPQNDYGFSRRGPVSRVVTQVLKTAAIKAFAVDFCGGFHDERL